MSATATILLRAAEIIEERGWHQFREGSGQANGRVCIDVALRVASWEGAPSIYDFSYCTLRLGPARSALGVGRWFELAEWNDAPGRTEDEVLCRLREAAQAC